MLIRREHVIDITDEEMFWLVSMWLNKRLKDYNPKRAVVIERILKLRGLDEMMSCPFPFDCNKFPCESLFCNGDECHNGTVIRRS